MLHVIYADPALYPPTINACRLQAAHGFEVTVVGLWRRSFSGFSFGSNIAEHYLEPVQRRPPQNGLSKFWEWSRFKRWVQLLVRRIRPDVIIGYDIHGFDAARRAAGATPVVFHLHDLPPLADERPVGHLYRRVAAAASRHVNQAAALAVPEESRLGLLRRVWDVRCPSFVVANCAISATVSRVHDADPVGGLLRRRLGLDMSVRLVVRAGGGGPAHLEFETIEALKLLPEDIHLCLIGCGGVAYGAAQRNHAKSVGVSRRVHMVEFVDYDTLRSLIQGAWLGLALYRKNSVDLNKAHAATASVKLMEYVAAGLPSVVTDALDFRAFSDRYHCVQLAASEDAIGIAAAIRAVYEESELEARLRRGAISSFEHDLNYAKQYQPLLDVVRLVAGREGR